MTVGLDIAFFGSSSASTSGEGAATDWPAIARALADLGHHVTFYEPDRSGRRARPDLDDPAWARVVVYDPTETDGARILEESRDADVIVKESGTDGLDDFLERAILETRNLRAFVGFWDVDAPATLARLHEDPTDPLRDRIPRFDAVFVDGGGDPVVAGYRAIGARTCVPIYHAFDPATHGPVPPDPRFASDLAFVGNRRPDREARVDEFFLRAAMWAPSRSFLLGGEGWEGRAVPPNVRRLGHVLARHHDALDVTPRAVLHVSPGLAANGWSPARRVFEIAGAGGCLVTDAWDGIEDFFEPGREVLVAHDGSEVAAHLERLSPSEAHAIGARARARVLADHTWAHRAHDVEAVFEGRA